MSCSGGGGGSEERTQKAKACSALVQGKVRPEELREAEEETMVESYNLRNPAVKRLMQEAREMARNEEPDILHAAPLADNLFEWHFTFRGPPDSVYNQGIYHGRVIFGSQYPLTPPEIAMITPSGRFETGTKICLSISNYHPETWLPSWSIRTAITALRAFMSADSPGSIGSVECSEQVRRKLANESLNFNCPCCGSTADLLKPAAASSTERKEEGEIDSSDSIPVTTPSAGTNSSESNAKTSCSSSSSDSGLSASETSVSETNESNPTSAAAAYLASEALAFVEPLLTSQNQYDDSQRTASASSSDPGSSGVETRSNAPAHLRSTFSSRQPDSVPGPDPDAGGDFRFRTSRAAILDPDRAALQPLQQLNEHGQPEEQAEGGGVGVTDMLALAVFVAVICLVIRRLFLLGPII